MISMLKFIFANILEDYLFNMQYYLGVEKYVYLNEELIRYRVTEDSLSRKYNPELANELKKNNAVERTVYEKILYE